MGPNARVAPIGGRYAAPPSGQNSQAKNIMNNAGVKDALANLLRERSLTNVESLISNKVRLQGNVTAAKGYIARLRAMSSRLNILKNIYGVQFNNQTRLENLLRMKASRNYPTWSGEFKTKFNKTEAFLQIVKPEICDILVPTNDYRNPWFNDENKLKTHNESIQLKLTKENRIKNNFISYPIQKIPFAL
jgi:hypothetical protein